MRTYVFVIISLTAGVAASTLAQSSMIVEPTLCERGRDINSDAVDPVVGNIVVSQIYGGGGNSGATYTHDFIEIFNRGTSTISINGWSVQYASATGSTWQVTNLTNLSLLPGTYYLIQEAQGAGGTLGLPTPDAVGTIALAATAGKVALVNTQTPLTGSCPSDPSIIDHVGYGPTANCFEGSGATPILSNTTAALRANNGCTDTDNNANDFTASTPIPRNTASPANVCPPTSVAEATPSAFSLDQNYPNPFNPETEIRFSFESPGKASLTVYDLLGREIAILFDQPIEPGNSYIERFNGTGLAGGIYFYRLKAGSKNAVKKMLLVK